MPARMGGVALGERIAEQRKWIAEHGGDLKGYEARYGTKGEEGCHGEGGRAIYEADLGELTRLLALAGDPEAVTGVRLVREEAFQVFTEEAGNWLGKVHQAKSDGRWEIEAANGIKLHSMPTRREALYALRDYWSEAYPELLGPAKVSQVQVGGIR